MLHRPVAVLTAVIAALPLSLFGAGQAFAEDSACAQVSVDDGWTCQVIPVTNAGVTIDVAVLSQAEALSAPDGDIIDNDPPVADAEVPIIEASELSTDVGPSVPDVPSTSSIGCQSSGNATWYAPSEKTCPPLHWRSGYAGIKDQTGSLWPVNARATYWDNWLTGYLNIAYSTSSCPAAAYHCIHVVEGYYGSTSTCGGKAGWFGCTIPTELANGSHEFASVTIKLNLSVHATSAQRTTAVTHELGHAIGLGHEKVSGTSCMAAAVPADGGVAGASYDDLRQLKYHTYS